MNASTFQLIDSTATEALGGAIGRSMKGRGLVFLKGDLGAGKTTMVRGLLRQLGFQGSTKSPTYTLVEPYQFDSYTIYHFDLYRLADPEELEFIGVDEYLSEENALCVIEWPEKGSGWLPSPHMTVELRYDNDQRQARLVSDNKSLIQAIESSMS